MQVGRHAETGVLFEGYRQPESKLPRGLRVLCVISDLLQYMCGPLVLIIDASLPHVHATPSATHSQEAKFVRLALSNTLFA
jgi:hypothetical protein